MTLDCPASLLGYLSAVYSGQDGPATLAQQAGVGFDILDRQYREFLEEGPGIAGFRTR
jgi:hypothetical protein